MFTWSKTSTFILLPAARVARHSGSCMALSWQRRLHTGQLHRAHLDSTLTLYTLHQPVTPCTSRQYIYIVHFTPASYTVHIQIVHLHCTFTPASYTVHIQIVHLHCTLYTAQLHSAHLDSTLALYTLHRPVAPCTS